MTDKKALFGWVLYDFANSAFPTLIVTFVYATYFTKAIAANEIVGTALWSRGVTISALCVAVLSPFMGAIADRTGSRMLFLKLCTGIAVVCAAMLYRPLPGEIVHALAWFVVGNIAFELGTVFYNSLLPEIAPPDKIGSISGIGWGLGYLGGLAAMFLAMATLVNPEIPWFGFTREAGQNIRATNLLVALWFALFSLPLFLFIPKHKEPTKSTGSLWQEMGGILRELGSYRQVVRFLLARLVYNDGLITIFSFGGIYAAGTFGFTFKEIMVFGIALNITAGAGAFLFGMCDDRLGGKKTVLISLVGLIAAAFLALTTTSKTLFWLAGLLVGIFSGPNQSASRSLMARFVPRDKENQFFGFFAFSGKFTAFLGPMLLGILTEMFHSQRAGMAVVLVFFIIGMGLLMTVNEQKGISAAQAR